MPTRKKKRSIWMKDPQRHDFEAAADFLTLSGYPQDHALYVFTCLRHEAETQSIYKAKDILRASGLRLLPKTEPHVAADLKRLRAGKRLSPVLLVRRPIGEHLIVADGYHRVCAAFHFIGHGDQPVAARVC